MDHARRLRLHTLLIFIVALALFTLGIWNEQPEGFDDRWALFLEEMFRHGPSLFPTTYGQPYADYPGTATFMSYLFARLFGAPNHLANIMPTAIASAGVVAMLYRLLAPCNRGWALLAVLLTALTTQWLSKSRDVCLDQMSSLLCLTCFYLLHRGEQLGSRLRQWAVFPLFALGFAIRGPLGLVEVCGVACTYWALGVAETREQKLLLIKRVLGYGIVGLLILGGGWWLLMELARIAGGEAFAQDVKNMQVGGRLDESGKPFFFYFQLSLYRYFPVVPLALATLIALRHRWAVRGQDSDAQLMIRLSACGLMILVGLSVPHFKRAYYVLPMVPLFAAVAAYGLLNAQGWLARIARFYTVLVAVLPGLSMFVVFLCRHLWHKHGYWPDVSMVLLVGVLVLLQVAAIWAWRTVSEPARRVIVLSLIAVFTQWWLLVKMLEPAADRQFDTRIFVNQVEGLRSNAHGTLVFLNLGRDTWAIRYMMDLDHDEVPQPLFIGPDDKAALANLPHPAWLIVASHDRGLLQGTPLQDQQPVYSGRLNGNPMVVFQVP